MKVYVVWRPALETILQVYRDKKRAIRECSIINKDLSLMFSCTIAEVEFVE